MVRRDSHELSPYPSNSEQSELHDPLLSQPGPSRHTTISSPPTTSSSGSRRRSSRRNSIFGVVAKRFWKPLVALSLPPLLLFLYAVVHPHVPGLPPLPKVSVHYGSSGGGGVGAAGSGVEAVYEEAQVRRCTCGDTDEGRRQCDVYGVEGLERSRLVKGTGARVRRMLLRGREGHKLKIGVLGGSVSACHGLHPSPSFPQGDPEGPGCYTTVVKQWFESTFPGVEHEFMNGAIGGMDSSYYAFCGTHHIALDTDLIILEFDVNDQTDIIYQSYFDQLLRVLLEFKSQPAVVILGAWSPQVAQDQGYGDPQIVHLPIAHYYDIPYISLKRMMYNHYLRYPQSTAKSFFQPDHLHPNARGHRVLADLLIAYFESELCLLSFYGLPVVPSHLVTLATPEPFSSLVDIPFPLDTLHLVDPVTAPEGWEKTFDLAPLSRLTSESRHFVLPTTPYGVPPVGLFTPLRDVLDPTRPDPKDGAHVLELVQPSLFCADANDAANPMKPTTHEGWEPFVWNGEKHFWVSNTVGARIRVEIKVNEGRVAVYYYRSQHYHLGDAKCWVDDNERGAVTLKGYWAKQYNVAVVAYIDEKVTPGDHYVTCEVAQTTSHPTEADAHHFRIVAVMAT